MGLIGSTHNSSLRVVASDSSESVSSITGSIPQHAHLMVTRGKNGILKPNAFVLDYVDCEPPNVNEALKHDHWRRAMKDEYDVLLNNGTWELVPLPLIRRLLDANEFSRLKGTMMALFSDIRLV